MRYATQLADQYGRYEPLPGSFINGSLTLGENIADLAGLLVAHDAYRLSLGGKEAPVLDGLTGDQRFFLGHAQIWRRKYRDAALRRQLVTGPHSPGHFRPYVVRNLDPWYPAFGVAAGAEAVPGAGRAGPHLVSALRREALQQDLQAIGTAHADRAGAWLVPAIAGAAALTLAALAAIAGYSWPRCWLRRLRASLVRISLLRPRQVAVDFGGAVPGPDYSVAGAALELGGQPAAITDAAGQPAARQSCVSRAFRERSRRAGSQPTRNRPRGLRGRSADGLARRRRLRCGFPAARFRWRSKSTGSALAATFCYGAFPKPAAMTRLCWPSCAIRGEAGEALARPACLPPLVDPDGMVLGCNRPFASRALGIKA